MCFLHLTRMVDSDQSRLVGESQAGSYPVFVLKVSHLVISFQLQITDGTSGQEDLGFLQDYYYFERSSLLVLRKKNLQSYLYCTNND